MIFVSDNELVANSSALKVVCKVNAAASEKIIASFILGCA